MDHGDDEYSAREAREVIDREAAGARRNIPERWHAVLGRKDFLILDTETTGLDETAEVVEVAVIDTTGALRLSELVLPEGRIPAAASKIHGLTLSKLRKEGARSFPEVHAELVPLLRAAKGVLGWNVRFDKDMLAQTAKRHDLVPRLPRVTWLDLMAGYKAMNPFESARLDNAVKKECPGLKEAAHRGGGRLPEDSGGHEGSGRRRNIREDPETKKRRKPRGQNFNARNVLRAAIWTVVIFTPIFFGPLHVFQHLNWATVTIADCPGQQIVLQRHRAGLVCYACAHWGLVRSKT